MQMQFKLVSTLKYKKKNVNTDNRFEKLITKNVFEKSKYLL